MVTSSRRHTLAVVICTYSAVRTSHLARLLEALGRQTRLADQVVLVVDHNPELLATIRRWALPAGTIVVPNAHGRGLSGGRNTGFEAARGDIVAFIDDDAIPEAEWLETLIADYSDPNVIGVGGPVEPSWEGRPPGWFPAEFGWVVGCGYQGLPEKRAPVRNFIGCNMSFRRDALIGSGGFRIDLGRIGLAPVGCEETELCIRLIANHPGRILRFQPAARVRHAVPPERMTWGYFRARCFAEGRSKARVAHIVGAGSALATERSYVVRTLTRGLVRNATHGSVRRSGAIVAGLATTTIGFLAGRWELALGRERLLEPAHQP
jgi:glucosyl-dolichyl phosphate glucuronosyltransferase